MHTVEAIRRRAMVGQRRLLAVLGAMGVVLALSRWAAPAARAVEPGAPEPAQALAVALQATPTRTPTPINIGNFVWSDLNGNGIQNAGEPALAGVTVQLWSAAKNALIDTAATDA